MAATIDVNVADQAYPYIPPGSQALPVPFAVAVAGLPAIQPSFSQGAATPATPNNIVATQNNTFFPVQDVLVTESGNYVTSNNLPDLQDFVINTVTTNGSGADAFYAITLLRSGVAAVLEQFGVDLSGLFVKFLSVAGQPTRPISWWSASLIAIPVQDGFGNVLASPTPGTTIQIPMIRQGPQDIFETNIAAELNVIVEQLPPVALTLPATGQVTPLGNIAASDGVVRPFIGEGQRLPPFIGTFQVEFQALLGLGLPINVFR
jgi:hypothetical protein